MQFENVAGAEDIDWMSRGVPNMLLTGLAQTRGLDLVSGQRLDEVMRRTGRNSLESLDRSQIADVARRAGAGAIVVGSIVKAGSEIRIDAQLEDLSSGRVLAADSVRGTDVFALVDQLAARIRDGVGLREAGAIRHVADVSTSSLDAYRYYSEGVTAYGNTRSMDARNLFEKAVMIDPTFAQAYLHLALVSGQLGMTSDAEMYAARAAEHPDRLDERQRLLLKADLRLPRLFLTKARFPTAPPLWSRAWPLFGPASAMVAFRAWSSWLGVPRSWSQGKAPHGPHWCASGWAPACISPERYRGPESR